MTEQRHTREPWTVGSSMNVSDFHCAFIRHHERSIARVTGASTEECVEYIGHAILQPGDREAES